ncbi:phospholipase D/nuclease [Gigaspora margarita]|uniref:phospholipase D n=3 Tax=Gigaspora margarita TaxID=4874 RepID=A0A8H4A6B1_GIGMA|nr:phospholipase D/nuclease [Gigaspora margarita]
MEENTDILIKYEGIDNPYGSFANVQKNVEVQAYIDGHDYFQAIEKAISEAKKEILIMGWWLSPELYLLRPCDKDEESLRLHSLFKKKADDGIKIFIILHQEQPEYFKIDSQHSEEMLQHDNIFVLRHSSGNIASVAFDNLMNIFDLNIPNVDCLNLAWYHHEKVVIIDQYEAFIGGIDLCFGRYDTKEHILTEVSKTYKSNEIWPGKDYSNPRIKDFEFVRVWKESLIKKSKDARMPWHDVSVSFKGKCVLDLVTHFNQRWEFIKGKQINIFTPEIKPSPEQFSELKVNSGNLGTCNIQILRSCGNWSNGINLEKSIQNAYIDMIYKAEHFIYIENQFFLTSTKKEHDKNLIGEAIAARIKRAIEEEKEDSRFRTIIILPLLPEIPGDLDSNNLQLCQIVRYQYQSIRGLMSAISDICKEKGKLPEDYITFYGLRNWGIIGKNKQDLFDSKNFKDISTQDIVAEQVYVHSNIMIVDDRKVICGSANLNDRSMIGDYDSEIAVIIEDTQLVDSKMNGKLWKAGNFAYTLRKKLFMEHIGLSDDKEHLVVDPICDSFYKNLWLNKAKYNTKIFRNIFHCIPDDNVLSWNACKEFVSKSNPGHMCSNHTIGEVAEQLARVYGHLVQFPLQFMKKEKFFD